MTATPKTPDMLTMTAEKPKKAKAIPAAKRGTQVAKVSGLMAGLPAACERAKEALEDIRHRCESARAVAGILTPVQGLMREGIEARVEACLGKLAVIRRDSDLLSAHDAIGVEKSGEVELF